MDVSMFGYTGDTTGEESTVQLGDEVGQVQGPDEGEMSHVGGQEDLLLVVC